MLIIGEKEMTENKISIRRHSKGDVGQLSVDEFVLNIVAEISNRKSEE